LGNKFFDFYFWFAFLIFLAFLIKLPLYLFHLWLSKAHVEAPAAGSMVLAAVLLKLRAYGIFRLFPLMKNFVLKFQEILLVVLLLGSVISALLCYLQADLKSLVAYSSVSHMGVIIAGVVLQESFSLIGG
jgi:NADH:ubiquinone oxidoreductase subunit 4 (subunit M)